MREGGNELEFKSSPRGIWLQNSDKENGIEDGEHDEFKKLAEELNQKSQNIVVVMLLKNARKKFGKLV